MNFILELKNILPKNVCENLISLFEVRKNLHYEGQTSLGINHNWKKDTEISLNPDLFNTEDFGPLIKSVLICLQKGLLEYKNKFTILNSDGTKSGIDAIQEWKVDFSFNFQRYLPNEGYKIYHCEAPSVETSKRVLAWMFYLNDVTDKGGTEFQFQNYICNPEEGKLVIWPSYWTHYHRGIPSPTQTKYIITGWCSLVEIPKTEDFAK